MQLTLKRTHPNVPHERYNATMWTVMMTGYAYSVGSARQDNDGWVVFNLGRKGMGSGHIESTEHATREQALAYIRSALEAEEATAHAVIADLHSALATRLGQAVCTDEFYRDAVIQASIINKRTRLGVETLVTPEVALAALDYLWADTDGQMLLTIEGMAVDANQVARLQRGEHACYAKWTIPAGSNDYHLPGWKSTSGCGRRRGE